MALRDRLPAIEPPRLALPPEPRLDGTLASVIAWREACGRLVDDLDMRIRRARRLGSPVPLGHWIDLTKSLEELAKAYLAAIDARLPPHGQMEDELRAVFALVRDKAAAMVHWMEAEARRPPPNANAADDLFSVWTRALHNALPLKPITEADVSVQDHGADDIRFVVDIEPAGDIDGDTLARGLIAARHAVARDYPDAVDLLTVRIRDADARRAA